VHELASSTTDRLGKRVALQCLSGRAKKSAQVAAIQSPARSHSPFPFSGKAWVMALSRTGNSDSSFNPYVCYSRCHQVFDTERLHRAHAQR
jgi:hypothetical protein